MQSIKKALLYGVMLWVVWTTITVLAYELLPKSLASSAFYVSLKTVLLAVFALLLTIRYMRFAGKPDSYTAQEGLAIGAVWAGVMVAFDMSHYLSMGDGFVFSTYALNFAACYVVLPAVAGIVMGSLRNKGKA